MGREGLLLLAAVLATAGCAAQDGGPRPGPFSTPAPATPAPATSGPVTSSPAPSGSLLTVERSGGITGRTSRVTVLADGTVQRDPPPTASVPRPLSPAELDRLRSAVAAADLAALPRRSGTGGADALRTEVTTSSGSVVVDGTPVPPAVEDLLGTLAELVDPPR